MIPFAAVAAAAPVPPVIKQEPESSGPSAMPSMLLPFSGLDCLLSCPLDAARLVKCEASVLQGMDFATMLDPSQDFSSGSAQSSMAPSSPVEDLSWLDFDELLKTPVEALPSAVPLLPFPSPTPITTDFGDNEHTPSEWSNESASSTNRLKAAMQARKRKLAHELSHDELARTRQVNRAAARRHRNLAKVKEDDRRQHFEELGARNAQLRQEVEVCQSEVESLKTLVAQMAFRGMLDPLLSDILFPQGQPQLTPQGHERAMSMLLVQ